MPEQGRDPKILGKMQKTKTRGKRARDSEGKLMMEEDDFSNLYILAEIGTRLAEETKRTRMRELNIGGTSVTESHILRSNFCDSEGPISKPPVGKEGKSRGLHSLSAASNLSHPQTDSENESNRFEMYKTCSGLQYIGSKHLGKSIWTGIGSSSQQEKLEEGSKKYLEYNTTGADSSLTGKTSAEDIVETNSNNGPELLVIGNELVPKRGTNFYKRIGRWTAHIWYDGKQYYLGKCNITVKRCIIYHSSWKVHIQLLQRQPVCHLDQMVYRAYDKATLKHLDADAVMNYPRSDYLLDIEEMSKMTKEGYRNLMKQKAKRSKQVTVAEGVTRCPEGFFEAKIKGKARPAKWRFLGFFDNLKDAKRTYQIEFTDTNIIP